MNSDPSRVSSKQHAKESAMLFCEECKTTPFRPRMPEGMKYVQLQEYAGYVKPCEAHRG